MKKKYLTPKQFRSRYAISISHVYNLLNDPIDPLPHYRFKSVYRIVESEIGEWLDRHHKIMERGSDI